MPALRIPGLVRTMNNVRAQLAAGIPAADVDAFRKHVRQTVDDVEQISRTRMRQPSDLAAPSYRAFQFLKHLDLERLPIRPDGAPPPPPLHGFYIANLVSICDGLHDDILKLADALAGDGGSRQAPAARPTPGDPRLEALRARLAREAAEAEAICRDGGTSPLNLPIRTRRAWQWARFLARPGNLDVHVATVAAAAAIGRPLLAADRRLHERGVRTLTIRLYHSNTLVGGRVEADTYGLRLHQGLMGAPDAVIEAAVHAAFGERWRMPAVQDYGHSAAFHEVMAHLEGVAHGGGADGAAVRTAGQATGQTAAQTAAPMLRLPGSAAGVGAVEHREAERETARKGPGIGAEGDALIRDVDGDAADAWALQAASLRATGRHHDLNASFDRVNRSYFGGMMPRPTLTWNTTFTRRKLGHYDLHTDTVMLSITLDDPKVPGYVVDFVMYHELLHKRLGVHAVNGRRRMHTPEFRKAERRFGEWKRVEKWMRGEAG